MTISGNSTQTKLVNLQPLGRVQPVGPISVGPADCADDAPC